MVRVASGTPILPANRHYIFVPLKRVHPLSHDDAPAMTARIEKSPTLGVSIVEDDEDIRANLALLISRAAGFRLVGEYGSAEDALEQIPRAIPEVALMDINLPGLSGIECAQRLKSEVPQMQIVMLTVYEDADQIFQSLRAGASGYLLKRTAGPKILEAIRDVHSGGSPMNSHIARKVVQYFSQQPVQAGLETLSAREMEVLESLARGRLYKEIADSLAISLDTVRKHLQKIYQKLHVHSRTEAVVRYLQK
jgi:DNA-binding NarL/FixJ family response regulator